MVEAGHVDYYTVEWGQQRAGCEWSTSVALAYASRPHLSAAGKAPPAAAPLNNDWWLLLANQEEPVDPDDSFAWKGTWASGQSYEVA